MNLNPFRHYVHYTELWVYFCVSIQSRNPKLNSFALDFDA